MNSNPVKVLTIFHTSDINGKWDFEKVKKYKIFWITAIPGKY